MKLAKTRECLYLASAQVNAWQGATPDTAISFERATLWYLNQAQDTLIEAIREHHGLKGSADETATAKELQARDLPSAALDQTMAWPAWWACRGQQPDNLINPPPDTDARQMARECYQPWVNQLGELVDQLNQAYAEY